MKINPFKGVSMKALMIMFLFVCSLAVFAEPDPSSLPSWARLKGPISKEGKIYFIGKSATKNHNDIMILTGGHIVSQIKVLCGAALKFYSVDVYHVNQGRTLYGYRVATVDSNLCSRVQKATPNEKEAMTDYTSAEILRRYENLTRKSK
jgi:hypothetical protein